MDDETRNQQDPSNFRQMVIESPGQFQTGFDLAKDAKVDGTFDKIVVSGIGGSALHADLLMIYLNDLLKRHNKKPLPIYLNRNYTLPPESYDNALNILCSYSGSTEETVSAFNEALEHNLPAIAISAGKDLETIAHEKNVPHVKLPIPFENFQPRVGTGYFIGAIYQILINQGLAPDEKDTLLAAIEVMKGKLEDLEDRGKALSQKLVGKTPIVHASNQYKAVAMVWKIKMNENAKTPAYWNYFPELNHNEMIGYTNPQAKFIIFMLRDTEDHPRSKKRFDIMADLIRKKGIDVELMDIEGTDVFSKIFTTVLLGDFASYYLALEYGQDPTPVAMVEEFKALMEK